MTKEEIKKKGDEKMEKINALAKELQISMSAEQVILGNGMIRNVIYYNDFEKYDVEPTDIQQ